MRISGHEAINHPAQTDHIMRETRAVARGTLGEQRCQASPAAAETDKVELSSRGKDAQRIQEVLHNTPEIRQGRVSTAKCTVETGTLNLSGADLADKILLDPLHSLGSSA
jgi:flagellar biosynthesis anti-sigma factor FlgM